jgi:hypothetical protein
MIALLFVLLILIAILAVLGHMSASARRQDAILRELQRPRSEARKKWLAENDTRNAWQRFFDWEIQPKNKTEENQK